MILEAIARARRCGPAERGLHSCLGGRRRKNAFGDRARVDADFDARSAGRRRRAPARHPDRPLRDRAQARRRRHGHRLRRARHPSRPGGGRQGRGPADRDRVRPGPPGARGAGDGEAPPSQPRHRLRHRREPGSPLRGDGAGRRRHRGRLAEGGTAVLARDPGALSASSARAGGGARRGLRAPGLQTRERPLREGRRRPRQRLRRGPHPRRF